MSKRVMVTLAVVVVGILTLGAFLSYEGFRASSYTDSTSDTYTEYNRKGVYFANTSEANHIFFRGGADTIQMEDGNDSIYMGAGNNTLHFGTGPTDTGSDQIRMNGGNDYIVMGSGADAIYMGADDGDKVEFATGTAISNNVTNSVLTITSAGDLVIQLGN